MNFDADYRMLIDGQLDAGDGAFEVVNPATGETLKTYPTISDSELESALGRAHAADPRAHRVRVGHRRAAP